MRTAPIQKATMAPCEHSRFFHVWVLIIGLLADTRLIPLHSSTSSPLFPLWLLLNRPPLWDPTLRVSSSFLPPHDSSLLPPQSNERPPAPLFWTHFFSFQILFFFFPCPEFLLFVLALCERRDLEYLGQGRVSQPVCWDGDQRWI